MTTNAQLLSLILHRAGRPVSQVRLLKLAYMVDLLAWRVLGKPISRFNYRRYRHGPFDADFYAALEDLYSKGQAKARPLTTKAGHDGLLVRARPKAGAPRTRFTAAQIHLVNLAIRRYVRLPLGKLLALVYQTEPVKRARFNQALPMEREKNRERAKAGGVSLPTILRSREEIRQGKYVTLEELKGQVLASTK